MTDNGPQTLDTEGIRAQRRRGYESARPDILELVPREAKRILDLGCSSGQLGAAIRHRQGSEVVGVEVATEYAHEARERLTRVHATTIENYLESSRDETFDCVVAADVLEHLADPWVALAAARERLDPGGTLIVSLPNVLFWKNFLRVIRDRQWPRDAEGVFDGTHLRWFSPADAESLVRDAGFRVDAVLPRYWATGGRLLIYKALGRTPLRDFLPVQIIVLGGAEK